RVAVQKPADIGVPVEQHLLHAEKVARHIQALATLNDLRNRDDISEEQHRKGRTEPDQSVSKEKDHKKKRHIRKNDGQAVLDIEPQPPHDPPVCEEEPA